MIRDLFFASSPGLSMAVVAQMSPQDLPDPTHWMTLGWVVAAIFGLVGLANQGMELWRKLHPPANPPIAQTYATKQELAALLAVIQKLEHDHDEVMKRIEQRFEVWNKDLHTELQTNAKEERTFRELVATAIGRIEAKVDAKTPRR
jgi:hypothetical protein